jgi:hypothetical protein
VALMPAQNINFLTPDLQAEDVAIQRKRRMADALLQQGMTPTQGRQAGNFYVAPSPLEGLARVFQTYAGVKAQERADSDTKDLYRRGLDVHREAADRFVSGASNAPDEATFNRALMDYGTSTGQPNLAVGPAVALAQRNMQLRQVGLGGQPQQPQMMPAGLSTASAQGVGAPWASAPQATPASSGGVLGNVPANVAAMLLSQDKGIQELGKAILEQNKPVVGREGAPILERQPDGSFRVAFYAPKTEAGVQLNLGPNGQVGGASTIPGYAGAVSEIEGARAGAQAQYRTTDIPVGGGATTPIPSSQIPQRLGAPQAPTNTIIAQTPGADLNLKGIPSSQIQSLAAQDPTFRGAVNATGAMPAVPRTQTTAERAEATQYGDTLGKQAGDVNSSAANAAIGNRYLDVMEETVKSFTPGKLAPLQGQLVQWGQALGLPVSEDMKKQAGDIQGLTSMAIKMAGQATRQSDAQPSQLQYLKMLESMPDTQRTPEGFASIVGYLRDTNNQAIAKAQALQQWRAEKGTADGFEAAWPEMATKLPFAWNQQRRKDDLKNIVNSTPPAQPTKRVKWGELGSGLGR